MTEQNSTQNSTQNTTTDPIFELNHGTSRGLNWEVKSTDSVDPGHKHTFSSIDSLVLTSAEQGDIIYNNGTDWVNLGHGNSGQYLKTQGNGANPIWSNLPASITGSYVAGETLTAGLPVALVPSRVTYIDYDEAHTNGYQESLGYSVGGELLAQTFPLVAGYFWGASLYLRKHGGPTDNLILYLYDANNVLIATSDAIAGTSLTTSFAWYDFLFADVPTTTAQTYKIVLDRTGANDTNNYYEWAEDKTTVVPAHDAGYAGGQMLAGATVAALATFGTSPYSDAIFKIYTASGTTSVLRKTKATSKILVDNFVGITEEAIANGSTGSVIRLGPVTGLSGLTVGEIYYLSDTVGALSTSVGTYGLAVLAATSATTGELVVTQPPLTTIPKFLSTNTQLSVTTSGNVDIYSVTIPGGTLGTNGYLRVTAYYSGPSDGNHRIYFYFGSKQLSATDMGQKNTFIVANRNSASAQYLNLVSEQNSTPYVLNFVDVATENTANDVIFRIECGAGGGSQDFTFEYILLEIIK